MIVRTVVELLLVLKVKRGAALLDLSPLQQGLHIKKYMMIYLKLIKNLEIHHELNSLEV